MVRVERDGNDVRVLTEIDFESYYWQSAFRPRNNPKDVPSPSVGISNRIFWPFLPSQVVVDTPGVPKIRTAERGASCFEIHVHVLGSHLPRNEEIKIASE